MAWRAGSAIIVLCTVLSWVGMARGDGVPVYRTSEGWRLSAERAQNALVAWKDGEERLLLQVVLDADLAQEGASRLVWVTPVPARAAEIRVDVMEGLPPFSGVDAVAETVRRARLTFGILASMQLWPAPAILAALQTRSVLDTASPPAVSSFERSGVAVSVASADSIANLGEQVRALHAELPDSTLRSLERYTGAGGSFVLYSVADVARARRAADARGLAVAIRFPSATGFFPLLASSTLPGDNIEVSVVALGFAHAVGAVPAALWTEYLVGSYDGAGGELASALGGDARGQFTRFHLAGAPSALVGDLRFAMGGPASATWAAFSLSGPLGTASALAFALLVFAGAAALAALVARPIWPATARPSSPMAAALGVLNLGTVIAPLFVSMAIAKRLGVSRGRALAFVAATSFVLTILLVLLVAVISRLGR